MTGAPTLGDWLETRRAELEAKSGRRLDWAMLATAVGISRGSFHEIRRGRATPRPVTKRHIERVFEWTAGSIDRIQDGHAPIRLEDQATAQEEVRQSSVDDLAAAIAELARDHSDQELLEIMARVMQLRTQGTPRSGREAG